MLVSRFTMCLFVAVIVPCGLHAQAVTLGEAPLADRCLRVELNMEFEGKITVKQDGKDVSFPHKAQAKHVFMERFLDATDAIGLKVARHYTTAEGVVTFNNADSSKRSLRADRRFLVTQRVNGHIVTISPKGPLTREEMEMTEHLDTMAIAGLLPNKSIDVGKSWTVPNATVLALCELDGVTEQKLEGTLESVKGNIAIGKIAGKAHGINLGAQVDMDINARFEFDIKQQRIVALEWKESDKRQQGPITPALVADVSIKLTRTPIEEPEELNKFALVKVPEGATPPANLTNIHYQDAKKRFELHHARDWHVTSPEDSPQLVMRNIERGDFIAQVTITPWKQIDPKSVMSLEKFADEMAKTPGWMEDKEISREQVKNVPKGMHTMYRVAASGSLDGVRTVQYFYLVVGASGDQLIVTFSVVPQQAQRLGSRDLDMVREIIFPTK